ncbi:hypothetical protein BY996DRAFT_7563077 [Phakopsora pachyrhizi]|nr:hypothetical protein BY996DRAFT_7563077 [Phakopsora pachyrhizi]
MNLNQEKSHPICLKVLRTSRPHLNYDTNRILNPLESLNHQLKLQSLSSSLLCLPNSFGSIYLGECFEGLVSIKFEKDRFTTAQGERLRILKLSLVVEIQTVRRTIEQSSSSSTLINKTLIGRLEREELLESEERLGMKEWKQGSDSEILVRHDLVELGLHSLVCTVSYDELIERQVEGEDEMSTNLRERPRTTTLNHRTFKKIYKFQVLNPLSVKTKVLNQSKDQGTRTVYLEVQIQNQSFETISFERINLRPNLESSTQPKLVSDDSDHQTHEKTTPTTPTSSSSSQIVVEDLNRIFEIQGRDREQIRSITLSPDDTYQLLFRVTDQNVRESQPSDKINQKVVVIGRLDLIWRRSMGELGRLRTSNLTYKLKKNNLTV